MKEAVDYLRLARDYGIALGVGNTTIDDAIRDLLAAITEAEKCEPVAWVTGGDCYIDGHMDCFAWTTGEFTTPLYTHPQQTTTEKEWVDGLCPYCLGALNPIPEGWMLVPKEPTDEMLDAARKYDWDNPTDPTWGGIYKVMLAAAPKP